MYYFTIFVTNTLQVFHVATCNYVRLDCQLVSIAGRRHWLILMPKEPGFSPSFILFSLYFASSSSHHLELVDLLQFGDFEGTVGLAGLHLQVVNLHVHLLHLVLHVKLLPEHSAAV